MKKVRIALFGIFAMAVLMTFQNCDNSSDPTDKEVTEELLKSKTTWVYGSVNVPDNTATTGSDWANFSVQFNGSSMVTQGHPTGSSIVWPNTSYTVSEDGKTISRGDGVSMLITSKSETSLVVNFTMPAGSEISGGRIASLEGDYTFSLK